MPKNYINPKTGQPCDYNEYTKACAGTTSAATPTPTATPAATGVQDVSGLQASSVGGWTTSDPYSGDVLNQLMTGGNFPSAGIVWGQAGAPTIQQLLAGDYPQVSEGGLPAVDMPTFDPGAVSPPSVTPAPPYEISPAQQELQETYGDILIDWVTNPQGIPPETQAQMIQLQSDTLKAREQENLRVMRNNMERRGITNSGYIQANENTITSNTSIALAGAIADVQIKSALMKMASFEKAMGAAAQFLGYLSEQSQLAYAPKFQTWQAEQLAKMQAWQASFDKYKMELNQAYQTQNINAQAYWTGVLQEDQQAFEFEMAEMEIEAQQEAAAAEGAGQLIGSASGLVGSLIAGS